MYVPNRSAPQALGTQLKIYNRIHSSPAARTPQLMKGRQAVRHPDGPRDQSIDISHLSVKSMAAKRRAYARWTIPGGKITTAAGQKLSFDLGRDSHAGYANLEWKYDGNVSTIVILSFPSHAANDDFVGQCS